ncbi:hypothetical protein [Aurantimonas sp. A2-1-M11]|uniref:hypothetical protein n=1 Tax=Aurantimonas sp. A2-1-M11 TaxID=3113712 RepID=UPI003FA581A7
MDQFVTQSLADASVIMPFYNPALQRLFAGDRLELAGLLAQRLTSPLVAARAVCRQAASCRLPGTSSTKCKRGFGDLLAPAQRCNAVVAAQTYTVASRWTPCGVRRGIRSPEATGIHLNIGNHPP